MDEHITNWIAEFLIREVPNSALVTQALTNLPIQNPTTRLKKSLLLRSIQSEIDEASLSEKTLESLELLEELTLQDGSHPTTTLLDSMKEAYLAVAVECTLKYLFVSDKKYSDAVDRIWRRRILRRRGSTSSDGSVLMTDELVRWGERIEEALLEQEKRKSLVMDNSRARAFNSAMVFLKEAWDDLGPSFLQAAAETLTLEEDKDKRKGKEVLEKNVEFEVPNPKEVEERVGQVRPSTPFVSETRESLKASCMELQAMVKDPLTDALRLAHSLTSRPSSSGDAGAGAGAPAPAGSGAGADATANAGAPFLPFTGNNRPSLMERKASARTYEWDDSPEAERNGPRLPSPERIAVSPLKKYGSLKFAKRRKKRRWSLEEEDALRKGVERFGTGNWKLILNCYREIFEERTEVDLKDKWRNMTR